MRTLYRNCRILDQRASALLVSGTEIEWLGAEHAVDLHTVDLHTVDLHGALVTPAFVDAHVHLTDTGLALTALDLSHAAGPEQLLDAVEAAARSSRGRPIIGSGWDDSSWSQPPPSRAQLDRAAYGGLVYLARIDAHSALVSSSLVASVRGIAALTGYAPDGPLTRDAHDAVRRAALSGLPRGQRRDAQRAALQHAASLGIACVHEMAGPAISSAQDLADALETARDEPVPEVIGYWGELFGIDTAIALGAVGAAGDLFCDGSLGSHTAALSVPYADNPQHRGELRFDTADLAEHIVRCDARGVQAGFHAIGAAAVTQVLDAIDAANARSRGRQQRVRIEHAEMITDVARFAASDAIASMQPLFDATWGGPRGMYAERLGAERAATLNDCAALHDAAVPLAFGSDSPVTPMSPWAAVRAAAHPHRSGSAVSAAVAFDAHTRGGWAAAGQAGQGRLVPGAPATFAVWDAPGESATLPDVSPGSPLPRCLRTVRAGTTIYDVHA